MNQRVVTGLFMMVFGLFLIVLGWTALRLVR